MNKQECPKCGSNNIGIVNGNINACNDCNQFEPKKDIKPIVIGGKFTEQYNAMVEQLTGRKGCIT